MGFDVAWCYEKESTCVSYNVGRLLETRTCKCGQVFWELQQVKVQILGQVLGLLDLRVPIFFGIVVGT